MQPNQDILASDGVTNFKKQLIMKADKVDIEKLYEIKSNKVDTENMLEVQQIMSKQFKHILILFIEVVNFLNFQDTKQAYEKK